MLLAIDPGKKGAYALFTEGGVLVETHKVSVPSKQRFFDDAQLVDLENMLEVPSTVVFEDIFNHRMPNQSPKSTNTTAINLGIQMGVCLMHGVKINIVSPAEWKRGMGLYGATKEASVELAESLVDPTFLRKGRMRKNNVDIAEAVLIGIYYGRKELGWE